MTRKTSSLKANGSDDALCFKVHPRAFSALGRDLVTSDLVAVMELVKNSYDALATRVDVRFVENPKNGLSLEIQDNGTGMTSSDVRDIWMVVATPNRLHRPVNTRGGRSRRVSGEKGLGRLSSSRLGGKLTLRTKSRREPCWEVVVDWDELDKAQSLAQWRTDLTECEGDEALKQPGTLLRITRLRSPWSKNDLDDLRQNLGRLVPPFKKGKDFEIWVTRPHGDEAPSRIALPAVFKKPPYRISGAVDAKGVLSFEYRQEAISDSRTKKGMKYLPDASRVYLIDEFKRRADWPLTLCGPFQCEFRVWDFGREALLDLAQRFNLPEKTTALREQISGSEFAGISLYRDDVLVLPKSRESRDWLGLDLRRISRLGTRLSANQIIGHVTITAHDNRELRDTSDRERLVGNGASKQLRDFVFQIVGVVENERDRDRSNDKEGPLTELFADLNTETLVSDVTQAIDDEKTPQQVLQIVSKAADRFDHGVKSVKKRFVYYSRLASLGTIAAALQHEVGNQTVILKDFVDRIQGFLDDGHKGDATRLLRPLELAEGSVHALRKLAQRFTPLATRASPRHQGESVIESIATDCVEVIQKDISRAKITARISQTRTSVAVDPGELGAVLLNLLTNAIYWLSTRHTSKRVIQIEVGKQRGRALVQVHDNGPGVAEGDEERVFWPGVTRRPGGLGMGLTVASELVAQAGGRMRLEYPGKLGGATFGFDLPLTDRHHSVREK